LHNAHCSIGIVTGVEIGLGGSDGRGVGV
jgi:hypothetical protein